MSSILLKRKEHLPRLAQLGASAAALLQHVEPLLAVMAIELQELADNFGSRKDSNLYTVGINAARILEILVRLLRFGDTVDRSKYADNPMIDGCIELLPAIRLAITFVTGEIAGFEAAVFVRGRVSERRNANTTTATTATAPATATVTAAVVAIQQMGPAPQRSKIVALTSDDFKALEACDREYYAVMMEARVEATISGDAEYLTTIDQAIRERLGMQKSDDSAPAPAPSEKIRSYGAGAGDDDDNYWIEDDDEDDNEADIAEMQSWIKAGEEIQARSEGKK